MTKMCTCKKLQESFKSQAECVSLCLLVAAARGSRTISAAYRSTRSTSAEVTLQGVGERGMIHHEVKGVRRQQQ